MWKWNDAKNIFSKLKNHLFFITLLTFLSIISTSVVSYYFVSPVYQASTDVLIYQKEIEENRLTKKSVQENVKFIPTYKEIINSSILLEQLIDDLALNVTADQLRGQITLTAPENSQLVNIAVTYENPDSAAEIANKLVILSKIQVQRLINLDNIVVLAPATIGEKISGGATSLFFNIAIAICIALICGIVFAFFIEYSDRTIKDKRDVLEVLDIPFLGIISPYEENKKTEKLPAVVLKEKES